MSDPKIVASAKNQDRPRTVPRDSSRSWLVLGWIGLAFLMVGGADFALTWFPPQFGNPEWEFGTVTQSFNGLPILLLGLGLLTVAAESTGRRWWGLVGLGASSVLMLWVLVGAVLWGLNVSLALDMVPEQLELGVRRAVALTLIQSVTYSSALAYLAWKGWTAQRGPSAAVD